jgi:transposase
MRAWRLTPASRGVSERTSVVTDISQQMNLALTINGDGVPIDHSILPGNENDVTGMQARLAAFRARMPEGRRLVVTDRGMVSADNLRSLRAQGFDFIAALKLTELQKDVIRAVPLANYQDVEGQPFRVHEDKWLVGPVPCRVVVIYSKDKAGRDAARRLRLLKEIRLGLSVIHAGLKKGRLKDSDTVRDKIRDLLKDANMMPFFDFKVESVAGAMTMRVTERADLLAKDEQMDGKYALVTNLTEPDGAGILRHYKSRAKIEQRNKGLKSHLRLGPIFVQNEERIHGLVLVNVLALLVYSLLEVALRRMGRANPRREPTTGRNRRCRAGHSGRIGRNLSHSPKNSTERPIFGLFTNRHYRASALLHTPLGTKPLLRAQPTAKNP